MKIKLLILTIATFILSQTIFAQTVEKQIAAIRAEVTAINKAAKGYTKKTKDVDDISLEGTQATYFSAGKNLRKITAKMYGETFQATGEYYFQGDKMIFAYEKMSRYNGQIGLEKPVKVAKIEEKRFYLSDGKLIRYLFGKKEIKSGSTEFNEEESALIDVSSKLKEAYNQ
jgi:hypothetical protein